MQLILLIAIITFLSNKVVYFQVIGFDSKVYFGGFAAKDISLKNQVWKFEFLLPVVQINIKSDFGRAGFEMTQETCSEKDVVYSPYSNTTSV